MARLQPLLDREAIRELKHRYAQALDRLRIDDLVVLFTEDAVCDFGEFYGTWDGLAAIRAGYQNEMDKVRGVSYPFMHAVSTEVITLLDADHATARWFLIEMGTEPGVAGTPLRLTGVYDDEYVRTGGGWKIRRTRLTFTWPRATTG